MHVSRVVVILCLLCVGSCINDKVDEMSGPCDSTFFVTAIKPILLTSCYDPDNNNACHNGSIANQGDFSKYGTAENGIESRLTKMKDYINRPLSDPLHMPQGRTLNAQDLNTLNNWLDAGGKFCN